VFNANVANTFTATQTFSGTTTNVGMVVSDIAETATITSSPATGTFPYDVTSYAVLYSNAVALGNWTLNIRANSSNTLNSIMSIGQSITVVFLVPQSATAYYNNVVQIDGATVTPRWQGGTAPTAGNANSTDVYSYTILKVNNAAFIVFASQTRFG
jgi:hypothetical protein